MVFFRFYGGLGFSGFRLESELWLFWSGVISGYFKWFFFLVRFCFYVGVIYDFIIVGVFDGFRMDR